MGDPLLALNLTECQTSRISFRMPTYEYACSACGHEWEQTQRIVDAPVDVCPKCAKSAAHRLISRGTNFILKGGGWYSDLYASPSTTAKKPADGDTAAPDPAAKPAAKESTAAPATEAKPGATETKPAAKSTASTPTTPSSG